MSRAVLALHLLARWRDDALVLAGLLLVAFGAGQVSPAASPIVLGLGLIVAVGLGGRRGPVR